jgi:hypothetical protein
MSRKTQINKLNKKLSKFLSELSKAEHGETAAITDGDINSLHEIFSLIVELKYEADCGGDRPVEFSITDRTICESDHFLPVPYRHKDKDGHCFAVVSNVEIAASRLRGVSHYLRDKATEIPPPEEA